MDFTYVDRNSAANVRLTEERKNADLLLLHAEVTFDTPTVPAPVSIRWQMPCTDIYSVWAPLVGADRHLGPDWAMRKTCSRLASGAPVHALISRGGRNRMTVAVSDARTPLEIGSGVIEENACVTCEVTLFTKPIHAISSYRAEIYLDFSDCPYEQALYGVEKWWAKECGYPCARVPENARRPMYSSWYSFHQNLDVEKIVRQCQIAKTLGMETLIVDDGWQTEDTGRGFSYCGDWEVAASKVPDMKKFVDAVHAVGMKFMLWFSVPFIGKNAHNFSRFCNMILGFKGEEWARLDPRYKQVRDYLVNIYVTAAKEWGIDGFKLDFIDSFSLLGETNATDERRDIVSLEDAVDTLLSEITAALREINPDTLIEFRQSYIGPTIRRYGNMLRVSDCPDDAICNRRAIIDLRFTSGTTAVHSDMLMWHPDESVESAAVQVIDTLFSVPQISVMLSDIREEQLKMLRFYLNFWNTHRDTLLDGTLSAPNPEAVYTAAHTERNGETVWVSYAETVLAPEKPFSFGAFVNGTAAGRMTLRFAQDMGSKNYTVYDCMGNVHASGRLSLTAGLHEFDVPASGMLVFGADGRA